MKKTSIIYCLITLLIVVINSRAQQVKSSSDCATNPPDFIHLSYEQANKAVNSEDDLISRGTKRICPEYITNLVNQLRHEYLSNGNETLAIYLLGELRPSGSNAIEFLIANIDFRTSKIEPNLHPARWRTYPAEDALMKIGKPVIDPILNHLSNEADTLRRRLMCEVLVKVEGKNGEFVNEVDGKVTAQNLIKRKLADESDPAKKANLEAALKELEK